MCLLFVFESWLTLLGLREKYGSSWLNNCWVYVVRKWLHFYWQIDSLSRICHSLIHFFHHGSVSNSEYVNVSQAVTVFTQSACVRSLSEPEVPSPKLAIRNFSKCIWNSLLQMSLTLIQYPFQTRPRESVVTGQTSIMLWWCRNDILVGTQTRFCRETRGSLFCRNVRCRDTVNASVRAGTLLLSHVYQ